MAFTTIFEGVVFVEGDFKGAIRGGSIKSSPDGLGAQLKSLRDIKHNLAQQAKNKGCNAILDFEYGQKGGFFSGLFSFDRVVFYGKGVLAKMSQSDYERLRTTS